MADKPTDHQVAIQCSRVGKVLVALAMLLVAVAGVGSVRFSILQMGGFLASTPTDGYIQGRGPGAAATLTFPQSAVRLAFHGPVPEGADGLDGEIPSASFLQPPSTVTLLVGTIASTRQPTIDHGFLTARTPTGPPAA